MSFEDQGLVQAPDDAPAAAGGAAAAAAAAGAAPESKSVVGVPATAIYNSDAITFESIAVHAPETRAKLVGSYHTYKVRRPLPSDACKLACALIARI